MTGPGVSVTRWLLLCALAFGVAGTHHLGLLHHQGSDTTRSVVLTHATTVECCGAEQDDHTEALLHLCLATLTSIAVLGALLLRRRRARHVPAPPRGRVRVPARRVLPDVPLPAFVVLRL